MEVIGVMSGEPPWNRLRHRQGIGRLFAGLDNNCTWWFGPAPGRIEDLIGTGTDPGLTLGADLSGDHDAISFLIFKAIMSVKS